MGTSSTLSNWVDSDGFSLLHPNCWNGPHWGTPFHLLIFSRGFISARKNIHPLLLSFTVLGRIEAFGLIGLVYVQGIK